MDRCYCQVITMSKINLKEMLNETSETAVPEYVTDFLEAHLRLSQYESKKQLYLSLMASKKDDILIHLKNSYYMVNFWRNLYLNVISKLDQSAIDKEFKSGCELGRYQHNC